jgi:hypothetical protein
MLSQIIAISFMAMFSSCPIQAPTNYVNNYLIPEGYRGWLIVRNKPGGKARPNELTYQFDLQGFCTSDIDVGSALFIPQYFYVGPSGVKSRILIGKDPNQPNLNGVYCWAYSSTATATSPEYLGEQWDIYFVGTPTEYESAKQKFPEFMSQYHLYKTVSATRN